MTAPSQTSTADDGPLCPICGSAALWDNRKSKTNPRSPDYRCKSRGCEGVIWKAPTTTAVLPIGDKPATPAAPRSAAPANEPRKSDPPSLCALYLSCVGFAVEHVAPRLTAAGVTVSAEHLLSSAATIFIARTRNGGAHS